MLQLVHDQLGHVGTGKMFWALKRQCTWPGMSGTEGICEVLLGVSENEEG